MTAYVCVQDCVRAHVCVCLHDCLRVSACACECVDVHLCERVWVHTCVGVCVCDCVYSCERVRAVLVSQPSGGLAENDEELELNFKKNALMYLFVFFWYACVGVCDCVCRWCE